MEASRASTRRKRGGSSTLDEATGDAPSGAEATQAPEGQDGPPVTNGGQGDAPVAPAAVLPVLPARRSSTHGVLEDKTVLIYGEAGIGKSTLASEWAGGDMFFFDTAGELNDLEVYKSGMDGEPAVTDWTSFRLWCAAYAKAQTARSPQFRGAVIDTADVLGMFCAQHVAKQLGIVHHADAEWGKGWDMLKREWQSHLAKLAALPGGLIFISHSRDKTIKRRREEYTRHSPSIPGPMGELTINAADLVLFVDWNEDGERLIHTKPDRNYDAKERGRVPRLPAEIEWPLEQSGYDLLRSAWDSGAGQ